MAKLTADFKKISVEEAYDEMAQSIAAKRIGRPEEVGDMCAYLCSVQASYISGQSIQLDGGSYAGIF
jgi:3-oxoacyl-[acyl-carrier protein] reductase